MNSSSQVRIPSIDQDEMTLFVIPNLTGTPERNLLMAILERAILDFVGNDGEALREAEDWIFDLPSPAMPFTFSWICQQLDLNDAEAIAQWLVDNGHRFDYDPERHLPSHV